MKKGTRINLRPLEEKDVEMIRQWRNRYKDHFFDASEISKEQQKKWYTKYQENSGTDHMYIAELKDGTSIGQIALYNISVADRTGTLGRVLLLEEFRGQGYAEEMVKLAVEIALNHMRLWKVRVEVFIDNIDAVAIYARSGFKTTFRPIMILEKVNKEYDPGRPINIAEVME